MASSQCSFFNARLYTSIGRLYVFDSILQVLQDSAKAIDSMERYELLQEARNIVESIASGSNIEMNLREVNDIYAQWLQNGDTIFDSTAVSYIYWLATSCAYTEGPAVYQARTLWNLIFDFPIWVDDDELCETYSSNKREEYIEPIVLPNTKKKLAADATELLLYPNPSNNEVTASLLNGQSIETVTVTDLHGRTLIKQRSNGGKVLLSLNNAISGVYICKAIDTFGNVYHGKLIVQH